LTKALLVGNSDGIGLATTRKLLEHGWTVVGMSRSTCPIENPCYEHTVTEVQSGEYLPTLRSLVEKTEPFDLCIYFVGIGEGLDLHHMEREAEIVDVNLLGMVKTASCVVPSMVERGQGHFIGLSSLADEMLSPDAPSYHASKAGFSNYLEGLALATRPKGVYVSNVRFGLGDFRPFMMSVERGAEHVLACIEKKPVRYTAPWIVIPLVKFRRWMLRLSTMRSRLKR
jgi:short-subunit dehydrogenase